MVLAAILGLRCAILGLSCAILEERTAVRPDKGCRPAADPGKKASSQVPRSGTSDSHPAFSTIFNPISLPCSQPGRRQNARRRLFCEMHRNRKGPKRVFRKLTKTYHLSDFFHLINPISFLAASQAVECTSEATLRNASKQERSQTGLLKSVLLWRVVVFTTSLP